jgi:SAM-dependent methyltransferase
VSVFRLTDVSDRQRESKEYWDQRVNEHWDKPYHGVYLDVRLVEQMDKRNFAVINSIIKQIIGGDESRRPSILECACGYGRYAKDTVLMNRGGLMPLYRGIDLADRSIAEAQATMGIPTLRRFEVGDMATWRPSNGVLFDLIFMVTAWSSIEQNSAEIIRHLKTLLALGGKIAIFEETLYMVIDG